jgi:hypothetical protein
VSQAAYTDDVDAARAEAELQIETVAMARGWSSEGTGAALDDIAAARAAAGAWSAFWSADLGESVAEEQVEAFWRELQTRAAAWTEPGSDDVRSWLKDAAYLAGSDAGGDWTPYDYAAAAGEVTADSAQDLRDVGESIEDAGRRLLDPRVIWAAAALVLVLVLANYAPRAAR